MLEEYGCAFESIGRGSPKVSIRINPGEGVGHSKKTNTGGPYSKHGIWYENLNEARDIAKKYNLIISGVHIHIGSGGDMDHLKRITGKLVDFAKEFNDLEVVNFGGGLPYQYDSDLPQADISRYKSILTERVEVLENHFDRKIICEIEPGRRFVAGCGYLIGEVRALNHTFEEGGGRLNYVLGNIGFCHLLRPMAYGAFHPIWIVGDDLGPEQDIIVAGPVCESGDVLTQKNEEPVPRKLPMPKAGDLIIVGGAGAYGFAMSSNYNTRLRPPEILIEGSTVQVIKRRESFKELVSLETNNNGT